jgi:thiol-disulfide isomerase/thioredoxin
MKRTATVSLALLAAALFSEMLAAPASAAEAPSDRVVVMYFHRTQRCPTCLKMGGYSEAAVKTGFAKQVKDGTVEFYYIDFQDKKNAALTKGYGISGPTLIVAKIVGNKVKKFKNLQDIWTHVGDKPAFLKYVRENVAAYLK